MAKSRESEMEGFYLYDPNDGEHDEKIPIWELVYGLQAAANVLNEWDSHGGEDLEGMTCAVHVLATLLCGRYTSETVIKKPERKVRSPGKRPLMSAPKSALRVVRVPVEVQP